MKEFDIYIEGYNIQGGSGKASLLKQGVLAETFRDACIQFSELPEAEGYGYFCEVELSFWGCGLWSNLSVAQKAFG